MKPLFGRREEIEEIQDDMEIINLDKTAEWTKLDIAAEMQSNHDRLETDDVLEEMRSDIRENIRKEIINAGRKEETDTYLDDDPEENLEESTNLEELSDDDIEYLNEQEDEKEEIIAPVNQKKRKQTSGSHWSVMDKVIAATGVVVLLVALTTGCFLFLERGFHKQIDAFAPLGEQLETIGAAGQNKLYAVADAQKVMMEAAKLEQEAIEQSQKTEVGSQVVESEKPSEIKVVMKMTSVEKDLKIKFVDKRDGKLVKKVPFEVKITDAENRTYNKKDEDQDGIIYLTGLAAGNYNISMVELTGVEGYSFSTALQTIKVKETIVYEKIDVTEEIKDQSEVDVTKEDTAQKIETEKVLADTVEWVESQKTEKMTKETFTLVSKDTIADPALSASLKLDLGVLKMMQQSLMADHVITIEENNDDTSIDNITESDQGSSSNSGNENGSQGEGDSASGSDRVNEGNNGGLDKPDSEEGNSGETNSGSQDKETDNKPSSDKIPAQSISLNFTQLTLEQGSENTLVAQVLPRDSTDMVKWYTSDAKVIKVDNGKVTAVGPGTAKVKAEAGSKYVVCTVTVSAKNVDVTGISISEAITLKKGESVTLSVNFTPENATDRTIKWTSEDKKKAMVDENGKVTAVAAGKIKITATSHNGKKAICTVTVTETDVAVKEVVLDKTELEIKAGKTYTLTPIIKPENASNKAVIWVSSDETIAKVDEEGKVSALKEGKTTITVVTKDGEKKAQCVVTVKKADPKISLEKNEVTMEVGESLTLKITKDSSVKEVTWKSSDKDKATVDKEGKVTAKAEGKVTISVTAEEETVECKVTISNTYDAKNDTKTSLKDKSGNQIYVLADGEYVEAKVADYYKYENFYKKEMVSEYVYTGWQNIDGRTYFFNKEGNKVTGEQVIQGAKYLFNSDGSLHTGSGTLGIDVSTWNGNIDWSKVKNSGVSYVIIRSGFRGSTQGALIEDNRFRQNMQGATNAGLKVGIYFFSQAINEVEAIEEASMVLSQVKGYSIAYPIFIDVEPSGGRADGLSSGDRTKVINAFCQTIQNGGYKAGIYANKTWLEKKMNIGALSGYKIWLAQYNDTVTYGGKYDMWQYSDKGVISGIGEKVDMNLSFLTY